MIFYFSATGNSKHAAEVIAEKTGDTAVDIVDVKTAFPKTKRTKRDLFSLCISGDCPK